MTPLMYAAENGHAKVVELLLAVNEVDVNAVDNEASAWLKSCFVSHQLQTVNCLHCACQSSHN